MASTARQQNQDHVLTPWSTLGAPSALVVSRASGAEVFDETGRAYLDFTSQLVYTNAGHSHPKIISAIQRQVATLATIAPAHATEVRGQAAKLITDLAPEGMSRIFFTTGGAEANENAIRMAREHTGRAKILSFYQSYHGATGAAINATGDWRRQRNEFGLGHVRVFGPNRYRSIFASTTDSEEAERAFHYLEQVILREGPESIAALLVEPVVGSSGLLLPPGDYLSRVRELTREHGIVLIFDEIMTGFGRTGTWFALEHFDAVPDLITFAKGVNSGYVPVGGVLISDEIANTWIDRYYPSGLTYSGHPLAMASIIASIEVMKEEGLLENARRLGAEIIGPQLDSLKKEAPILGDVRGIGMLWALELIEKGTTASPLQAEKVAAIAASARDAGLLVLAVENRIHLAPPLTLTTDEAHRGLEILRDSLLSACSP